MVQSVSSNGAAPEDFDVRASALRGAREALDKKRSRTSVALGGSNTPTARTQIKGVFDQYEQLAYMLPWEVLDYVELLAIYNPDFSQAVENIATLANSGHELFVEGSGKRATKRIKSLLERKSREVQAPHGGVDGLIDKLLRQGATFGAMCGEWVVNEELTEVVDFIDVNPKTIRFFWGETEQRWLPFQKVNAAQAEEAKKNGQEVRNSCVRLNELTFHYYAFNAAPGSPYGTPPFLAALSNIAIQRDMVHNMSQIVKKVGLLGIIDLVIEQLPPKPNESDEQYAARAGAYLDEYARVVEEMVRDGGIVHFDDVEVNTSNLTGNAAGATNIFKQNEELVFSGLKSMPSVQGRSYSTTETYAGVAYDIILRNTARYQRAAKRMIEAGWWLTTTLAGESPEKISVGFNQNKTLHRVHDAQAHQIEIRNALMKWITGILDQDGFAMELGHSSVATELEEPPVDSKGAAASEGEVAGERESGDGTSTAMAEVHREFIMNEVKAALLETVPADKLPMRQDEEPDE